MKCPRCDDSPELSSTESSGESKCVACTGKLIEAGVSQGELLARLGIEPLVLAEVASSIGVRSVACPSCEGQMVALPVKGVQLDRCASCESLWIDAGEHSVLDAAKKAGVSRLRPEDVEERSRRRQRARRGPFYDGHAGGGVSPARLGKGAFALLVIVGLLLIGVGISGLLVGEMTLPAGTAGQPNLGHEPTVLDGGGALLMIALFIGGGGVMVAYPVLRWLQDRADDSWGDFADSLDDD